MGKVGVKKKKKLKKISANRSAQNVSRSSFHLPGSELILYLGLHKKSINAWKACKPKQNAKVFPVCKNKTSAGESVAHLHFLGLIIGKLDQKRN